MYTFIGYGHSSSAVKIAEMFYDQFERLGTLDVQRNIEKALSDTIFSFFFLFLKSDQITKFTVSV